MRSLFVKRKNGEENLLIILITSICTILLTRLFLDLAGYPQIGNDVLHIAHLLWGGLFLLIAMIFLILYKGILIRRIASFIAGIGWGLFFDEVGKFITQNNDYYFKPAASVMYLFFLFLTGIYIFLSSKKNNLNEKEIIYNAVDNLEEIVENDLDDKEKDEIISNLEYVGKNSKENGIKQFSEKLLSIIKDQEVNVKTKDTISHFFFKKTSTLIKDLFEKKQFAFIMLFLSILYFIYSTGYMVITAICLIFTSKIPENIYNFVFSNYDISSNTNIAILLGTFTIISLSFFIVSLTIFFYIKNTPHKFFISTSIFLLLFLIIFINIFIFYISQFSAVIILLFQILLLNFIKSFKNGSTTTVRRSRKM